MSVAPLSRTNSRMDGFVAALPKKLPAVSGDVADLLSAGLDESDGGLVLVARRNPAAASEAFDRTAYESQANEIVLTGKGRASADLFTSASAVRAAVAKLLDARADPAPALLVVLVSRRDADADDESCTVTFSRIRPDEAPLLAYDLESVGGEALWVQTV